MPQPRTIFTTPVFNQVGRFLSWLYLTCTGWKINTPPPKEKNYVLIAIPHTTNWDFCTTLAMAFRCRVNIHWIGKHTLFKPPIGSFMRWMGGISIDRSKRENAVDKMVDLFKQYDNFVLTIAPEGTRSKVKSWKTGFYHIASGAKVPVVLGFLNHTIKEGGFGPCFYPTGNLKADLQKIIDMYRELVGDLADTLPSPNAH